MKAFISVAFFALISCIATAQQENLKATYLYQFAKIIQWPDLGDSFTIGVWGESEIGSVLEVIAKSKKVMSKDLVIEKVNDVEELASCQIIFLPSASVSKLSAVIGASKSFDLLIVTDGSGLVSKGAGISFVDVSGKVLFELGKSNMAKNGLISVKLLERLAHKVY
ncbi:MAG: YfiR family protein [Cytophagales bacterium]|nr:YfiR family protein [Cytophagales bacterium]